jgi:hypothetical protein
MRRWVLVLLASLCVACGQHSKGARMTRSQAPVAGSPTLALATAAPTPPAMPTLGPVYRIGEDITPPELLAKGKPDPDTPCKGHRVQGIGIFEGIIDQSGSVRNIRMIRGPLFDPPCPAFEESYRAAFSKWKYKPATHNGKPVAFVLTFTVHFHF